MTFVVKLESVEATYDHTGSCVVHQPGEQFNQGDVIPDGVRVRPVMVEE